MRLDPKFLAWQRDPYRIARPQIMRLLQNIIRTERELRQSGTPNDYRILMSSLTGDAAGIINFIWASEAYPHKEDIYEPSLS